MNYKTILRIALFFQLASCFAQEDCEVMYPTFYAWATACNGLAYYKDVDYLWETPLTSEEFSDIFVKFNEMMCKNEFVNTDHWLNISDNPNAISNYFLDEPTFQPFVQKECIKAGAQIAFKGDIHGDIHSLIQFIEELNILGYMNPFDPFTIINPNFYIVFLGDYTDRGVYGAEVLYTLMRLKISNPSQVFLLRGNHEDIALNVNSGLCTELQHKFEFDNENDPEYIVTLAKHIARTYNFLPVCLFLGIKEEGYTRYLQCCHGGIEVGHNPSELLANSKAHYEMLTALNRRLESKCCPSIIDKKITLKDINLTTQCNYGHIGYMWSDFSQNGYLQQSERGEGIYIYGKTITEEILNKSKGDAHHICGIFRAHQHANCWTEMMNLILDRYQMHPEDKGCAKLWRTGKTLRKNFWDGIVCTLMVSPDNNTCKANSQFPGNQLDFWSLLSTNDDFDKWELTVHKKKIYEELEPDKNRLFLFD